MRERRRPALHRVGGRDRCSSGDRRAVEGKVSGAGRWPAVSPADGHARRSTPATLTLEYEFKHALYREVLYRRLSAERPRRISIVGSPKGWSACARRLNRPKSRPKSRCISRRAATTSAPLHICCWPQKTPRAGMRTSNRSVCSSTPETCWRRFQRSGGHNSSRTSWRESGDAHYTLGDVGTLRRNLRRDGGTRRECGSSRRRGDGADAPGAPRSVRRFGTVRGWLRACRARLARRSGDPTLEAHARLLASCWRIMIDGWRQQDAESCAQSMAALRRLGSRTASLR